MACTACSQCDEPVCDCFRNILLNTSIVLDKLAKVIYHSCKALDTRKCEKSEKKVCTTVVFQKLFLYKKNLRKKGQHVFLISILKFFTEFVMQEHLFFASSICDLKNINCISTEFLNKHNQVYLKTLIVHLQIPDFI